MYRTLHDALRRVSHTECIVAEDISKDGKKKFYTGDIQTLNKMYTELASRHWYEVLLEDRPTRLFLDIESKTNVSIDDIVNFFKRTIKIMFGKIANAQVIDSCSAEKYSWHVVFTNVILTNSYHVGAFVRRSVLAMQDDPMALAIDTAVYTKHRMFRLAGSTKFGQIRELRHALPWHELLVQPFVAEQVFDCLEIDDSIPVSTSAPPHALFECTDCGEWCRKETTIIRQNTTNTCCPLLSPILDWLDRNYDACTVRYGTNMSAYGHYRVSTRSKKCGIAGRVHKGNNIWFNIDIYTRTVQQRCYDEECRRRGLPINVPASLWSKWNNAWMSLEPAPKNENTLYNMSY